MSEPIGPPEGFAVGHWTDSEGATGCTVVIPPAGSRGGVDVRGGGPGTRETDVIGPLAGTREVTAVLLTGGSAFGLAAADGVTRWLEENGQGYATPAGLVPIVPAAVLYDLRGGRSAGAPGARRRLRGLRLSGRRRPRAGQGRRRHRRRGRKGPGAGALALRRASATQRRGAAAARRLPRLRSSTPSAT